MNDDEFVAQLKIAYAMFVCLHIVTCQAHPVLVKKANQMCSSFLSLAPCLVATRAVRCRPRLAGKRKYANDVSLQVRVRELPKILDQFQVSKFFYSCLNKIINSFPALEEGMEGRTRSLSGPYTISSQKKKKTLGKGRGREGR